MKETVYVVAHRGNSTTYIMGVFKNKSDAYGEGARVNLGQAESNLHFYPHLEKMIVTSETQTQKEIEKIESTLGEKIPTKDNWIDMESMVDLVGKFIGKLIDNKEYEKAYELSEHLVRSFDQDEISEDCKFVVTIEQSEFEFPKGSYDVLHENTPDFKNFDNDCRLKMMKVFDEIKTVRVVVQQGIFDSSIIRVFSRIFEPYVEGARINLGHADFLIKNFIRLGSEEKLKKDLNIPGNITNVVSYIKEAVLNLIKNGESIKAYKLSDILIRSFNIKEMNNESKLVVKIIKSHFYSSLDDNVGVIQDIQKKDSYFE